MKGTPYWGLGLAMLGALSLGSCSLAYSVEIIAENGRVVFVPYELGFFGSRQNAVVRVKKIEISAVGQRHPRMWSIKSTDYNGTDLPRVIYGYRPPGFEVSIGDKPLKVGQLYRVSILALGGGGDRYFVISDADHYRKPDIDVLTASPAS